MSGYTETILKYASDDSRAGTLEQPDGVGEIGLGPEEAGQKLAVRFMLKLTDSQISTIRYQVFGCGYTMAACAAAAEQGEGLSLAELESWSAATIDHHLGGLPAEREYCADIVAKALQAAASSAQTKQPVRNSFIPEDDHKPAFDESNLIYRSLIESPPVKGISVEDRHLFACLLTIAANEAVPIHEALGLSELMLDTLLIKIFPAFNKEDLFTDPTTKSATPPEINPDIQQLLLTFVRQDCFGWPQFASLLLARILAARAAHPGHLWVAMGLSERPQLSAAIGRHLPSLLAANNNKMRWKRYLFKQVCEMNGGLMCKSPVCGDCSDYALCFAPEEK